MGNIKENPQYQIYLCAVEALRRSGYEVEETSSKKKLIQSFVKKDFTNYGQLFVVEPPSTSIIGQTLMPELAKTKESTSDWEIMRDIIHNVNNSRKRGRTFWPNGSLVAGFTSDLSPYRYNDEWLQILETVITNPYDNRYVRVSEEERRRLAPTREQISKLQGCISAGLKHTICLKTNGTVLSVGDNSNGQCNTNDWQGIIAVATGKQHTVGLCANSTVCAVGNGGSERCNTIDWQNIIQVSAGEKHTVGLKSGGTVIAVGDNFYKQCDTAEWEDIIMVSAGDSHTVGLKADGTVVAIGNNSDFRCVIQHWRDIVSVSAGWNNTIGLKADGTVLAMGDNQGKKCNTFAWKDIVAIAAGNFHTVGLKADGTVIAVGYNTDGQCDTQNWHDIVAISAGDEHTIGLKSDGTVVATGNKKNDRCAVDSWRDISSIVDMELIMRQAEEFTELWRRKDEQSKHWKEQGLCSHCGGQMQKKKCIKCGRKADGGCFIATSCYGNYDATEVLTLRIYRDERLLTNWLGTALVKFYYFVSPPLAQLIEKSDKTKNFIRKYLLSPIVRKINQKLNKEE